MREFQAQVSINQTNISFTYIVDDKPYEIHVPKTANNAHLKHGQIISVALGILTHNQTPYISGFEPEA